MDWRRWASIARLSIRKMCCLNGSRKLRKCAENKYSSISITFGPVYFPHEVRFSVTYWRSQFSGSLARLLMPVPLPFSPSFIESISTCYYLAFVSISGNGCCKYNNNLSDSQPYFVPKCQNVTFRPSFCLYQFGPKARF